MNFLDDYSEYELEQRYYIIWYLDIYRTYEKEVTVEEFVKAIEDLSNGIKEGKKFQTLLGVTGSGKTFKMANIIEKVQKPTLVLAHNKTLARPTIF